MKARVYHFLAIFLAVFGVILFGVIYTNTISGQALNVFRSPRIIGVILIPFLPAAVMTMVAKRTEKKWLREQAKLDETES